MFKCLDGLRLRRVQAVYCFSSSLKGLSQKLSKPISRRHEAEVLSSDHYIDFKRVDSYQCNSCRLDVRGLSLGMNSYKRRGLI
jgi:hypothetical protein